MKKILVSFLCALCFLIQVSLSANSIQLTVGSSTTSEYSENIHISNELSPLAKWKAVGKGLRAVTYGVTFAAGFVKGFVEGFTQGPPEEKVAIDTEMLNYEANNLVSFN